MPLRTVPYANALQCASGLKRLSTLLVEERLVISSTVGRGRLNGTAWLGILPDQKESFLYLSAAVNVQNSTGEALEVDTLSASA